MSFSAKLTFLPGLLPFTLSNLDIIPSTFSIILLLLKVCLKFILIIYVCFFQSFLQNGFFVCKLNFFGKFCLFLCNLIIALYLIVILFFIFLLDYLRIQILNNQPAWADYDLERVCHVNPFLRLPEFCTGMGVGFIFFNRGQRSSHRSMFDSAVEMAVLLLIPAFSWVMREYAIVSWVRRAEWGGPAMALWVQYTAMVFVFAVVIYVFARSQGILSKFLGSRALVFLGEISFALYMIHYTVIIAVEKQYDWSLANYSPWTVAGCVIAMSVGIAALLYKLVEMPAKNALLSLYSRQFKKAVMTFPLEWGRCLKTPVFWGCAILLVVQHSADSG